MKRVLIIISILLLTYSIGYCQEINLDDEIKKTCNQAIENIYKDILEIKGKYKELQDFDESVLRRSNSRCLSISYSYNIEQLSKKEGRSKFGDNAFGFSLSVASIDEIWQARNSFENLSYPNLGIKFYGFFIQPQPIQSDLIKDISTIVDKNAQLLKELDQKRSQPNLK